MSEWSRAWPAPAKLNLMLRVLGRQADGYHRLQTVFQFIGVCDLLDFRRRDDARIERVNNLPGVAADDDLIVRAATLLQQHTGKAYGVDIRVHKRLPMGGGLGGGSSDAATTLVALNQLWECGLQAEQLAQLGLRLGADVPIFVHGRAAWAEGVGERFSPIELPECWYLVLIPDCHVSTAAVFGASDLTRDSSRITIRAFAAGDIRNDCLPVVIQRYPQVAQAIDWLSNFAEARLTGTGACVFAAFDSEAAAQHVLAQAPSDLQGMVAPGVNHSPLLQRLAQHKGSD